MKHLSVLQSWWFVSTSKIVFKLMCNDVDNTDDVDTLYISEFVRHIPS